MYTTALDIILKFGFFHPENWTQSVKKTGDLWRASVLKV
jgi:hypothetical protein